MSITEELSHESVVKGLHSNLDKLINTVIQFHTVTNEVETDLLLKSGRTLTITLSVGNNEEDEDHDDDA